MNNSFVTYQLIILLRKDITLKIGALGEFQLPAGYYVYTGSARKNFEKRIERHFKRNKKLRWHIDYLTSHPAAEIIEVKRFSEPECQVNQQTEGKILIPDFGASDCKAHCGAHLKYVRNLSRQTQVTK